MRDKLRQLDETYLDSCDRNSFVRSVICDFGYDNNQR